MYYLVSVDHNHMAARFTRSKSEGFWECYIPSAVDDTDDDMLRNGSEENRNVRSEYEEDEGTDCEDGDSDTDW